MRTRADLRGGTGATRFPTAIESGGLNTRPWEPDQGLVSSDGTPPAIGLTLARQPRFYSQAAGWLAVVRREGRSR